MGKYEGLNEIVIGLFKKTFGTISSEERKRINWLSNFELNMLFKRLVSCWMKEENSKEFEEEKIKVLKLLR